MSEETNNATVFNEEMVQATAQKPEQTQSTAVNVDIDAIVTQAATKAAELAEKKNESVFKSMLQQSGLDDAAIQSMLADYKSKQTTPEQTIKRLKDELEQERGKVSAMEQAAVLKDLQIPTKELDYYKRRITEHAAEKKLSFADAAKAYMEIDPLPTKVSASATYGGAGKTAITPTELDEFKAAYEKAQKSRDSVRMVELRKFAKQKGYNIE